MVQVKSGCRQSTAYNSYTPSYLPPPPPPPPPTKDARAHSLIVASTAHTLDKISLTIVEVQMVLSTKHSLQLLHTQLSALMISPLLDTPYTLHTPLTKVSEERSLIIVVQIKSGCVHKAQPTILVYPDICFDIPLPKKKASSKSLRSPEILQASHEAIRVDRTN